MSVICGWDIQQLSRAASDWAGTAEQWEESFTAVHRGTLSPGGTVWEGQAAEAAQERSFADLVKVGGLAEFSSSPMLTHAHHVGSLPGRAGWASHPVLRPRNLRLRDVRD
jgi:hypothetical protein